MMYQRRNFLTLSNFETSHNFKNVDSYLGCLFETLKYDTIMLTYLVLQKNQALTITY